MGKNKSVRSIDQKSGFLEKVMQWGIMAVFLLVPLLYSSHRIAGTVTSKQFFFIGAVDLLVIIWMWLMAQNIHYRWTRKMWLVFIPGLLVLLSWVVTTLNGSSVATSVYATIERGVGLIFVIHAFLFAGMIASVVQVQGVSFIKKVGQTILCSAVIAAIFTFFTDQAIDVGSKWLNGTSGGALLGNSTIAGAYFMFALFFAGILWFTETITWKRIMYVLGVLVLIFSPIFFNIKDLFVNGTALKLVAHNPLVIIGQARAAVLSVILGAVLALLVYAVTASKKKWLTWIAGSAIVVMMLGIGYVAIQIGTQGSAIQGIFKDKIGENRLIFWNEAVQGIKEKPLLGWGPENFRVVHNRYLDPVLLGKDHNFEIWVDKPHNMFIETLVTQGIIGFILYVGLLLCLFGYIVQLMRKNELDAKIGALMIGMLFAYVLQNQFAFDTITSTMCFWAMAGIVIGLKGANHEAVPTKIPQDVTQWIGWGITGIMVVTWIFFSVIPSRKMIEAKTVLDAPTPTRIKQYEQLFSGFGARYLYTDIGALFYGLAESYSEQRQVIAQNPGYVEVAIAEMGALRTISEREITGGDNDYRLLLEDVMFQEILLSFKKDYTQEEVAQMVNRAKRIIETGPTNPLGYLLYSRTLVYGNDINMARSILDQGVALNPTVSTSHDTKMRFERSFGTRQQQDEALKNAQKYIPDYQFK